MSNLEIILGTIEHCAPFFLEWLLMMAVWWRLYQRHEFRKYEKRRRRYSEWRLRHLDEV